jgi:hypothetical protein
LCRWWKAAATPRPRSNSTCTRPPYELPADTIGEITQALGSSFTLYVDGFLLRFAGEDADAIGEAVPTPLAIPDDIDPKNLRGVVWEVLKSCYDPEIPVNIVALGMVYVCDVLLLDDETLRVSIKMTSPPPAAAWAKALPRKCRPNSKRCRASAKWTWISCSTRPGTDP